MIYSSTSEQFSIGGKGEEAADQTWMLAGEQWASALSREEWRAAMSSRGTDEGSGRRSPAASEAFAMASWCAMSDARSPNEAQELGNRMLSRGLSQSMISNMLFKSPNFEQPRLMKLELMPGKHAK